MSPNLDTLINESANNFAVHGSVYTDPQIFALEMERIFGRTWVYLGHESELPAPGDYISCRIGLQPILVTRSETGALHAFFNRCRHRGAVVCRNQKGNARQFRCFYHGWVYNSTGKLVGLPQRSGYSEDFPQSEMGLVPIARLDTYGGLIFGSLSPDVHSLSDHLGATKRIIDLIFAGSPDQQIVVQSGSMNLRYPGNWKFALENTGDGYHGNYAHDAAWQTLAQSRDEDALRQRRADLNTVSDQINYRELGDARGYPYGHGSLYRPMMESRYPGLRGESKVPSYFDLLESKLGKQRLLEVLSQHNLSIFPNLYLGTINSGQIWKIQPVSVDETEVYQYGYGFAGAPAEICEEALRFQEQFFGPAGFGTPDDLEAFTACQAGLKASSVHWVNVARGMFREQVDDAGVRRGHSTDETPQRALYREWHRLMAKNGATN
jgi:phenylpropionate dioxygenase-like ring-hydroxylating dioxygenase large terminal subunit